MDKTQPTQGLTFAQMQQMGATSIPTPPPAQGMSFAQMQQLGATPVTPYNGSSPENIADDVVGGVENGVGNFTSQAFTALKQTAAKSFQNLQGDIEPLAAGLSGQTPQQVTPKNVVGALSAMGKATIGTVSDLSQLVLSPITATMGTAINNIADATSDIPAIQSVATSAPVSAGLDVVNTAKQAINDWATAHPTAYKQLSDIINVAGIAAGGEAAPGEIAGTAADISAAKEGITNAADVAGNAVQKVIPQPLSVEEQAAQTAATAAEHQTSLQNDWNAPSQINKPSYNVARKVLAQSPEATETLAKMGINPSAYVEDGNFNTQELANEIRERIAQESSEQLRPALQFADTYTPPVPVSDIVNRAIENIKNNNYITDDEEEPLIASIKNKGAALERKNPDGMTLVSQHDSKIRYGLNSGYSPVNDPAVNMRATANRALRDALASSIEHNAPENLPVHEVNQDLSKAYGAADYLDALHTKKAPVTFAQQAARFVGKFGGAALVSHLPFVGGDLISDFAGYQIGKYVESALENMSRPGRAKYLANMEQYEPQSYSQLEAFVNKNRAGNPELARLMPANSGTPIRLPGIPEKPQSVVLNANKTLPTQNPKTGRMQKTYTSEGTPPK